MKTKFFTFLLAIIASIGIIHAEIYSGSCGESLSWSLNSEDSTLTIIGDGDMTSTPWSEYKTNIGYVVLPNGLNKIADSAFKGCSELKSINIPESVTSIGNYSFYGCYSLLSVQIPENVSSIGGDAFGQCNSLRSVNLPHNLVTLGTYAFESCYNLTDIEVPNTITSIGSSTFRLCTSLTSLVIPSSVNSISFSAFSYVPNVEYEGNATGSPWGARSVNGFVDGLLVYRDYTKTSLLACASVAEGTITIPASVTNLTDYTFFNCPNISTFISKATTPPVISGDAFPSTDKSMCTLYVPSIAIDAYQTASGWSDFVSILPVDGMVLVVFQDWDGTELSSRYYAKGSIVTPPENPSRDGFIFIGWDKDFSNVQTDLVITAQYQEVESPITDNGTIAALFSISATKQIMFSRGNLQYNATLGTHACADGTTQPGTWRFAEQQYDVMLENNLLRSATYDGWIDLFTYGASGYNGLLPYRSNVDSAMYAQVGNLAGSYYDFGLYNAISNGGNEPGKWRIITGEDFDYICNQRNNASSLRGHAVIGDVHGMILLPDNCNLEALNNIASFIPDDHTLNSYSYSEWEQMESLGAIFLPCGRALKNTKDSLSLAEWYGYEPQSIGQYMRPFTPRNKSLTSICIRDDYYTHLSYLAGNIIGVSVRLVQDVLIPNYYIHVTSNNDEWGSVSGDTAFYEEPITLTAIPNEGYHFVQWNDGNTENPRSFMLTTDSTIIAEFAPNIYTLNIICDSIQGTIDGESGTFEYLTEHTFTIVPNYGYHFTQWNDGITDNPRTIVLSQDTTFIVELVPNIYNLNVSCDSIQGAIEGESGTFEYLTEHTFTVVPNYGYHFTQWSDGNTENPRTIIVSCDSIVAAEFEKNTYTIQTNAAQIERGSTIGDTIVSYLDTVNISVLDNYGYHFTQWSDGNTDNPRSIVLTQDTTFTAEFAKNIYNIEKIANVVQGTINGIEQAEYLTEVLIEATPNYGYHFIQWSDGNTDNPRALVLTQDTTFIAEFAKNTYSMDVSCDSIQGSIEGESGAFEYLTEHTFTALPNYGYHFTQWNDSVIDNPRTIVLSQDTTFAAEFVKNTYTIEKIANAEQGSVDGVAQAEYLSEITFEAVPNYGYHFTQWSDGNSDNPRTIALTQDTTFTAEFAKNIYAIEKIANTEQGIVNGIAHSEYLSEVSIEAVPNYGYHFTKWSDGNSDNPRTIVLTQDTTFTAEFAKNMYSINVSCDNNQGTIDGESGTFEYLTEHTFAVVSSYGYHFTQWSDGNTENPRTIILTQDTTFTAEFTKNMYYLNVSGNAEQGFIEGESGFFEYLTEHTFTAISHYGYTFAQWSDGITDSTRTILLTQDTTIIAQYNINYYLITFLNYDGTLLSEQNIAYNHAATEPILPTRDGYNFIGWTTDIDHITARAFAIALYEKDGIFITYKNEDGVIIFSEQVALHIPEAPSIEGKSFSGWLTEVADNTNGIVLRATYTKDNPTTNDDVTVVPSSTTAQVNFPYVTGAVTYILIIRDLFGRIVCKIMFNSNGQLLGIAFAPGRNRNQQQAQQTSGFSFTVEGLDPSTTYEYEFVAHDETDQIIETLTGSFTTEQATDVNNVSSSSAPQKVINEGNVFILRGDKTYTITGQEVK